MSNEDIKYNKMISKIVFKWEDDKAVTEDRIKSLESQFKDYATVCPGWVVFELYDRKSNKKLKPSGNAVLFIAEKISDLLDRDMDMDDITATKAVGLNKVTSICPLKEKTLISAFKGWITTTQKSRMNERNTYLDFSEYKE